MPLARLVLLCLLLAPAVLAQSAGPLGTAYVGGRWYDGAAFESRDTTWAAEGVFVEGRPDRHVRVVDLGDAFVVPPYGDAHTHMLADPFSVAMADTLYVRRGILYALVLTNTTGPTGDILGGDALPEGLDVAFANGGLTSTGSHPAPLFERLYRTPAFDPAAPRDASGWSLHRSAYWFLDTLDDVAAEWPAYLATRPGAAKVYLTYNARCDGQPSARGCGLRPSVLAEVVRRAHDAGVPVFAHVNTADDVRRAVEAGVDALAHLPIGNDGLDPTDGRFLLDAATLDALAASGTVAVATASLLAKEFPGAPTDTLQAAVARQRAELRRLRAAGVPIALGADQWARSSAFEAGYLDAIGALDRPDLLDAWTRVTPQAIFPNRAIGVLAPGFEASLLALACDPLADWACTAQITHRETKGLRLGAPIDEE